MAQQLGALATLGKESNAQHPRGDSTHWSDALFWRPRALHECGSTHTHKYIFFLIKGFSCFIEV